MNKDEKSIAYAFISEGVQIYLNEKIDYFLISKLICSDCGFPWYMNLTECFLCGVLNSFLYRCETCKKFESITKSNKMCNDCKSEKLFMSCPNKDCISNKNEVLFEEANKLGGTFDKNSGFLTSQHYCNNCGGNYHEYKNYKVYVRKNKKDKLNFKDLNINKDEIYGNTLLVLKNISNDNLMYGIFNLKNFIDKEIPLNNLKTNFADLVNKLFPN